MIPNSVEFVSDAFGDNSKCRIYCYPTPYLRLKLMYSRYNYNITLCGAPAFYFGENVATTQSTASCNVIKEDFDRSVDVPLLDVKKMNVFAEASNDVISAKVYGNVNDTEAVVKGLKPGSRFYLTLEVAYSDEVLSNSEKSVTTEDFNVRSLCLHPTSLKLQDVIDVGDAEVVNEEFTIDGKTYSGKDACLTGLTPGQSYNIECHFNLANGYEESLKKVFSTPDLELTTLAPKGVSSTSSIVAAKTNISDEETSVGFQWRKSDAPETLIPKEGYVAVYDGLMEGYIKNLQPTSYYDVRPFYKSAEGKYYYGEWVAFDPSDFSFFEPTVHTNAAKDVTDNSATLVGYALAGTDDIVEQGFEYWAADAAGNAPKRIPAALIAAESDKITIAAAGQRMLAAVDGLKPSTAYSCRAYVKTAAGIVYGENQSFTTDISSGISTVSGDAGGVAVAIYDVSGRKADSLLKGINIVRYPDGSIRKINVK